MKAPLLPTPAAATSLPPAGDAALVRAAIAGDRRACRDIWVKYTPLVQRLVRRFFGPGPDHPDVCQEAFLRIFRRLRECHDPDALAGFVMSVTLGVARNEARRQRIRSIMGLRPAEDLPPVATESMQPEAREGIAALYRILQRLSASDRSLFVTRHVEKLEIAEVAVLHNISLSTAKRRLRRLAKTVEHQMQTEPALGEYMGLLQRKGTP